MIISVSCERFFSFRYNNFFLNRFSLTLCLYPRGIRPSLTQKLSNSLYTCMSCINTVVLFRSCSKIFYLVTSNVCTCRRSLSRSTLWWLSREAEAKTNPVTTHLEEVDPATTQWRQQPAARCFWLLRWHLSAIDVVFFFFGMFYCL